MAINWSKGAISLGGSFKDYSAQLKKDEYMAAASAVTAQDSLMGRYGTILDSLDDEIKANRNTITGKIISEKRENEIQRYRAVMLEAIRQGKALPDDIWKQIQNSVVTDGAGVDDPAIDGGDGGFLSAVGEFLSAAWKDLSPELKEVQDWLKSNVDETDFVQGPRGQVYPKDPEALKKALGNASKKIQAIKDWWASISRGDERLDTEQPANVEGADPELQQRMNALGSPIQAGLIEQGTATPEQEATMAAGGTLGGSGYVEPEIEQETVSDISGVVGSEEALTSLFRDVGGPVGEPAGKTIFRDFVIGKPAVEIEVSSPEIEEIKSIYLDNAFNIIRNVESNADGYTAVVDTVGGDRGLTTSTVGEAVKKHKNNAIGIGQFKYKEFMVPTAKKWFGMTEDQLKEQMFTPQFQDALMVAGLYDAGLQELAENKISLGTFQKRMFNIWRGSPPDKDTKKGDVTDKYGNKAGISGEEYQRLMQQGLLGQ